MSVIDIKAFKMFVIPDTTKSGSKRQHVNNIAKSAVNCKSIVNFRPKKINFLKLQDTAQKRNVQAMKTLFLRHD